MNNLSRFPQPVELDLRRWEGVRPVELLGGVRFPQVGELPYLLTLGGYGFYWIRLPPDPRHQPTTTDGAFGASCVTTRDTRTEMTAYLAEARWFGGKGRTYDVVDVTRVGTLPGPPVVTIDIITVSTPTRTAGNRRRRYQMPLSNYPEEQDRIGHAYIGPHFDEDLGDVHTYDALHDREAMQVYLEAFAQPHRPRRRRTAGSPSTACAELRPRHRVALDAVQRRAEQLLGRVRRRQPDEGVPQGHARAATPTSRSTCR